MALVLTACSQRSPESSVAAAVSLTGTWERVSEGLWSEDPERISFLQTGDKLCGRHSLQGGFQEYTGELHGRELTLERRDHGIDMLVDQGFPKQLAADIEGTTTARLALTLAADGMTMAGDFTPEKIEFIYQPPKLTKRSFVASSHRTYRRVSQEMLEKDFTGQCATPR